MVRVNWINEKLREFEDWCIKTYEEGKIKAPLHLSRGNEKQLIEIFKKIDKKDWVFSTYRSHYHALLHGINEDWLKNWILEGKSIHVMNKEHKFFTSAIVGGCLPIALGVALALKLKKSKDYVWIFAGDMTATLGLMHDIIKFAHYNNLPINFVIENNGFSTDTPTGQAWGSGDFIPITLPRFENIICYNYKRELPHYGIGKFVTFKEEK